MNPKITKPLFLAFIALFFLSLSSCDMCCKTKNGNPPVLTDTSMKAATGNTGPKVNVLPVAVSAIVIDEHGAEQTGATGAMQLQGPPGANGTTGPLQNIPIIGGKCSADFNAGILPATVTVMINNPSAIYYTTLGTSGPHTIMENIIANTAMGTPPQFEATFINSGGTATTLPANSLAVTTTESPVNSTSHASGTPSWVIFPVTPNTKYTFSYTDPTGGLQTYNFTTPATWGVHPTVGQTFVLQ
jgi:hypothetical protein